MKSRLISHGIDMVLPQPKLPTTPEILLNLISIKPNVLQVKNNKTKNNNTVAL